MKQRKRAMAWRHFERIYGPLSNGLTDSQQFEHRDTLEYEYHHVWTLVQGDGNEHYVVPGYHMVNRLSYFITERPWTDEQDAAGLVVLW